MKKKLLTITFLFYCACIVSQSADSISYTIGTKWHYETVNGFAPPFFYDFKKIEIVDTFSINGTQGYLLNDNGRFYYEDHKMYFWDDHLNAYHLYYDFNTSESYVVTYWDILEEEARTADVQLDSISKQVFNADSISVYHFNAIHNSTGQNQSFQVYKNLGAVRGGLKVELGCGLCDDTFVISELRCFETEDINYSFVDLPCDTSYYWIPNHTKDISSPDISIFPNPSNDMIDIEGASGAIDFLIYSTTGQLIKSGTTYDNQIKLPDLNTTLIMLKIKDKWVIRKAIRSQ